MATRQITLFSTKPVADLPIGHIETEAHAAGYRWILGVDEAGRGPLAGPVTAAGVLIDLEDLSWCEGLADSKKLTARRREDLRPHIEAQAIGTVVQHVHADEVDRRNVLAASLWGMRHCAETILQRMDLLAREEEKILVVVDGKQILPDFTGAQQAVIKGDARSFAVAAASILAKVTRDAWMRDLHAQFPMYGFDQHKGYPTKMHLEALDVHGVCPHHRKSFAPVSATIARRVR